VRISQQQLGIILEDSCKTSLIDRQRFGGAPEPHEFVCVPLARGDVAGDLHFSLELAQVALGVERGANAAHGALAGAGAQQFGKYFSAEVHQRSDERKTDQHHQDIDPDRIPAGLDAMDDEPQ
jgi:hypothetical protein